MILVDVVPSSRYSIKSIIFERLRSFLRQKERATWNETKRKNFRNNIQHPFKYFTDPPPPPLPPRSPTIHIYYFLSLFFFLSFVALLISRLSTFPARFHSLSCTGLSAVSSSPLFSEIRTLSDPVYLLRCKHRANVVLSDLQICLSFLQARRWSYPPS